MIINIEKAINQNYEKNVKIGAEMEVYIIDEYNDEYKLLSSDIVLRDIYREFDERVYRDYYPYQLEIRTNPSDDPAEVSEELCELIREAQRVAKELQCNIAPVSYIKDEYTQSMFCGFHVHVSIEPEMSISKMADLMFSMYPFVFTITKITLSSPVRSKEHGDILSIRQIESPHIGVPPLNLTNREIEEMYLYSEEARGENRYYDIIINVNKKEGRRRVKDVNTIEIRMFDSVGLDKAIHCTIEAVYNIAKFVDPELLKDIRKSFVFSLRLRNLLNNMKHILIKDTEYICPLTLVNTEELLKYLEVRDIVSIPWIQLAYLEFKKIILPEFHKYYKYPIRF